MKYTDIETFFFEEKVESDKIEFKGYAENIQGKNNPNHTEKENDVLRTICGMLNSEGGIIIWGHHWVLIIKNQKSKFSKVFYRRLQRKLERMLSQEKQQIK